MKKVHLHPLLTGLVGFILATAIGFLTSYLLFKTGLLQLLLNLVPEDQPLVRVLLSLFLVFVGMGLGGAVNGVLRGYTLHLIDRGGSRRRYLLGGAFAYGISQGVLLIPMLLLIAIIGKYNPGSSKDPASFLILFTLLGGIYGLVSGLILALITLRLRYIWLPWLASIVGTALGGAMLGLVIWQQQYFLGQSTPLLQSMVLFMFFVLAFGLAGSALGLAYHWVEGKRLSDPERKLEPRRWQDISRDRRRGYSLPGCDFSDQYPVRIRHHPYRDDHHQPGIGNPGRAMVPAGAGNGEYR